MKITLITLFVLLMISPLDGLAKTYKKSLTTKRVDTRPNEYNKDIWTYTAEVDMYSYASFLNMTLDYSDSNGWDIQLANYNDQIYGKNAKDYTGTEYLNISKSFYLNKHYSFLLGSQIGTTLFTTLKPMYLFEYGLFTIQPNKYFNIQLGSYFANSSLTTTTDVIGYITGFTVNNYNGSLILQGDYYSGENNVSSAVINLLYSANNTTQPYIGVEIPETSSGNDFYGIVGLNYTFNNH